MINPSLVAILPRAANAKMRQDDDPNQHHIPELDGLRGVAILAVFLFHYVAPQEHGSIVSRALGAIGASGWVGVDLFFVLSGFLITNILLATRMHRSYFLSFYARRALRIFPIYYLFLAAVWIAVVVSRSPVRGEVSGWQPWLWCYLTNVKVARDGLNAFIAGDVRLLHFWSLAVEEQFYLVWPAVVLLLGRRPLAIVCGVMIILVPMARTFAGASPAANYVLTPLRMDPLLIGALIACVRASSSPSWIRAARMALIMAAAGVGIVAWKTGGFRLDNPLVQRVGYSCVALGFGAWLILILANRTSAMGALLRSRVLRMFGRYSYAIYIVHFPLAPFVERVASTKQLTTYLHIPVLAAAVHVAFALLISLAAAWISWNLIEKHFISLKRHFRTCLP